MSLCLLVGFLLNSSVLVEVFCLGKLGLFPFWFWVFRMFDGVEYRLMMAVISIYKIIPIGLRFSFLPPSWVSILILLNSVIFIRLLRRINNVSQLLSILVIFSTGWLIARFWAGVEILVLFFGLYATMLLGLLFREKEGVINNTLLLLYAGLPPLFSFFAKLIILTGRTGGLVVVFLPLFLRLTLVFVVATFLAGWKTSLLPILVAIFLVVLCH